MAITINYNGIEIETTETDANELRDMLLEVMSVVHPQPVLFKVDTPDGAASLLIHPGTSLIIFDTDPQSSVISVEPYIVQTPAEP